MIPAEQAQKVILTRHAAEKMRDRDVTRREVIAALTDPEVTEPNDGCTRFVKDGIAYVTRVENGVPIIITVLLRSAEEWTDSDARIRRGA